MRNKSIKSEKHSTQPTALERGYEAIGRRWWSGISAERYWMEVINVEEWGQFLVAPEHARHALMHDIRVGDTVLHWVGKNNPRSLRAGLYGFSTVKGSLKRNAGVWLGERANLIELQDYSAFEEPITLEVFREHSSAIFAVLDELRTQHLQTTYFPFHDHPKIGLKTNQRYLSKFPRSLMCILPELREIEAKSSEHHPRE